MDNEKSKSDREAITKVPSADFNGDTHFQELTPKQKLEWLAQAAEFVFKYKGLAAKD